MFSEQDLLILFAIALIVISATAEYWWPFILFVLHKASENINN